jgi:hypothetical protein
MSTTVAKSRGKAFQPPEAHQIEERARFDVMRTIRNRPQLQPIVLQMRGEEIAWGDIYNHLLSRVLD